MKGTTIMVARRLGTAVIILLLVGVRPGAVGDLPLVSAVKQGHAETVRALMARGVDVNTREADGTTALHWAIYANDFETAQLLTRRGADAKAANRYGVTPLWLAARHGNAALVEMLLDAGADANTALPQGETVLMAAARTNSAAAVKKLLARGADPNAKESWYGQTALMWAAAEDRPEAARTLIEYGADLNARSRTLENVPTGLRDMTLSTFAWGGFTALQFAARQGSLGAARVLIEAGADMSVKEPEFGITPLLLAIMNGHFDVAALFVEKGADLTQTDNSGRAPMYAAVDMHSAEHVINRPPTKPSGRLDSMDLVRLLLARGADPNAKLARGARGGATQGEGATPLMRAAKTADVAMMRILLEHGANPHLRLARTYTTVLTIASGLGWSYGSASYAGKPVSQRDAVEAITLCLDHGVDINAATSDGTTALHAAAAKGADTVIQFLVTKGARLDARDKRGQTPLDVAVSTGARSSIVQATRDGTVVLLRQLMATEAERATPAPSLSR